MSNPNNCAKCDHKANPQGGWCYMFRDEPTVLCMCHTMHRGMTACEAIDMMGAMQRRCEAWQFSKVPHHEPPNVRAKRGPTAPHDYE